MADPAISLIPIRSADLAVGKPLPYAVYDWHGKLLLAAGRIVSDHDQLNDLAINGYMHDTAWDPVPDAQRALGSARSRRIAAVPQPPDDPAPDSKDVTVAMDEVRWHVGETLYLQLVDNSAIRYTTRLIGYVKNKTVLVTAPIVDGKVLLVRDGQTFVARAFSGKKAYAFIASAVKSLHSPHPYLHLSYPREVRCAVVRRAARAEVRLVAAVSLGDERVLAATLTDLSMGGASGTIKEILGQKGERGEIKFKVSAAGHDEFLNLGMVLRSVTPNENGDGYKHGFEFVDVPMHARLILSAYVHEVLVEGGE